MGKQKQKRRRKRNHKTCWKKRRYSTIEFVDATSLPPCIAFFFKHFLFCSISQFFIFFYLSPLTLYRARESLKSGPKSICMSFRSSEAQQFGRIPEASCCFQPCFIFRTHVRLLPRIHFFYCFILLFIDFWKPQGPP